MVLEEVIILDVRARKTTSRDSSRAVTSGNPEESRRNMWREKRVRSICLMRWEISGRRYRISITRWRLVLKKTNIRARTANVPPKKYQVCLSRILDIKMRILGGRGRVMCKRLKTEAIRGITKIKITNSRPAKRVRIRPGYIMANLILSINSVSFWMCSRKSLSVVSRVPASSAALIKLRVTLSNTRGNWPKESYKDLPCIRSALRVSRIFLVCPLVSSSEELMASRRGMPAPSMVDRLDRRLIFSEEVRVIREFMLYSFLKTKCRFLKLTFCF